MDDRAGLGSKGEKIAERYLRRRRFRIVTRNYRCPMGEIDLIALDGSIVVFVEVKTRGSAEHADPQDAVNSVKQLHLARTAEFFLRQTHSEHRQCRFDVVAITSSPESELHVEHLPDAFVPTR